MKINQKGSSFTVTLIAVVVIGLISVVGLLVYARQTTTPKAGSQQQASNQSRPYTFTLPAHWSQMSCSAGIVLISPNSDKATNCDDRTNLILVTQDPYASPEPLHCLSEQEIATYKQSKPLDSYTCSTLTIAGKQVLKETTDQGIDEQSNKVISVNYTFVQNKPLRFRYQATADGNLLYADVAEQLVKSVKF